MPREVDVFEKGVMPFGLGERIAEIGRLLEEEYGRPALSDRDRLRPLDELVMTILSQHTSDANSYRAFQSLKRRFPSWEEARDAGEGEIAEAIKSGGLAGMKAPRIKSLLQWVSEQYGSMDLDFLARMSLQEARELLLKIQGVGPKTAACVLLFSCDLPAFPVDTHVHRVSRRLGIIPPKMSANDAHLFLEAVVPPEEVYPFHVNLIRHGRQVCKAPRPHCERCILAPLCAYYAGTYGVREKREEGIAGK